MLNVRTFFVPAAAGKCLPLPTLEFLGRLNSAIVVLGICSIFLRVSFARRKLAHPAAAQHETREGDELLDEHPREEIARTVERDRRLRLALVAQALHGEGHD